MKRLRAWLAAHIAPCACVITTSSGQLFEWREVDASRCNRRGHHNDMQIAGQSTRGATR